MDDQVFHEAYAEGHVAERNGAPVLVVVRDDVVLCRGPERVRRTFLVPEFHRLKMVAHAPIAFYMTMLSGGDRERLGRLRASLGDDEISARTRAATDSALRGEPVDLAAFARPMGPLLLRATEEATALELRCLHEHTEALLANVDPRELVVVVTGDHQARVRSLPMQYFEKRKLDVIYAEAIDDVERAVELAGKALLDRTLAAAFFGDARRLQRDVLGDAAKKQLRTFF